VATLTADTCRGIASAEEVRAARARDNTAGEVDIDWVKRFDQAVAALAGERSVDPDELRRLILDEATGRRAATLGQLVDADQGPGKAAFRRWKTDRPPAPQIVGVEE
jgi:hypothetical protein